MSQESNALLRLEGLTKYFAEEDTLLRRLRPDKEVKQVRAVDGVDLVVRDGETLGLVGESGCGKSTLARTAVRLLEPTSGSIYYRNEDITTYDDAQLRAFRSEVQMIFQDPFASLNPRYTVQRTLVEPMTVHDIGESRTDRIRRAAELLDRVGLSEDHLDRYPHEFSGGQRQRIAIARALAVEPELLVADEPTSALDVSIQAQILSLLTDLKAEMGLSMMFISHNLSVVRRISDRIAVMYLGELVETAPTGRLFTDPAHPYTQALLSSVPIPDPTRRRERIRLEGDVPPPIDPPSGCRFHPRCPKVIPPEEWVNGQREWRRIFQCKKRIENGAIRPTAIRSQLASERNDAVTDADVVTALYDEHITKRNIADRKAVSLPEDAHRIVTEALSRLVAGDRSRALKLLNESFTTVCETHVPRTVETNEDQTVLCHLHDQNLPGTPDSPTRVTGERGNAETD